MKNPYHNGLTLIELLAVLAVLTILFAVVQTNFNPVMERLEARSKLNGIYHLFQQGRSTAIMENSLVTICPLDEHQKCSKNWNQRIHLFLDPNNERQLNDTDALIQTLNPPRRGTLEARPGWKSYFQFKPDGTINHTIGNITYCPQSGRISRSGRVTMSWGGRARFIWSETSSTGSC